MKREHFQPFGGIFLCKNGSHITILNMCDGKQDCPSQDVSDEVRCECENLPTSSYVCKFLNGTLDKGKCSELFFLDSSGKCQFYGFTNTDQQQLYEVKSGKNSLCSQGQLPCDDGSTCYLIKSICVYKLDTSNKLIPCKAGDHLQTCSTFVCNMMFKCTGFYCVPHKYVCDSKRDCPGGLDEITRNGCQEMSFCRSLFKCESTNICIHTSDVCDGVSDCLNGDDEYFCSLKGM